MAQLQPAGMPRPSKNEITFTSNLRWEFLDEEGRALAVSYAIAVSLGLIWILLVIFGPKAASDIVLLPQDETGVTIELEDPAPPSPQKGAAVETPAPGPTKQPPGRKGPESGSPKAGAIEDAFGTGAGTGTGGMVGDVSNILRGTEISSGSGSGGTGSGRGGKAVLGYGQGGQGSRTPGRGGFGGGLGTGGGGGGGVGGVGPGGGVVRAAVRVQAPSIVAPPLGGGPGRDVGELGSFVRSRESQLRFCYQEYGLKANPSLAGTVTVAITLSGTGSVNDVGITRRTWSGAGASEAEGCIRSKIRSWRFPSSATGAGTYGFPFNFTPG